MTSAHHVRLVIAKEYGYRPSEVGRLPVTYFHTLLQDLFETQRATRRAAKAARNRSQGDDDVVDVDIDAAVRAGQRTGFTNG